MLRDRIFVKLTFSIIFAINFNLILTQGDVPSLSSAKCPPKFKLSNGMCYPNHNNCPEGYFLHTDNLCHPIERKPCTLETLNETQLMTLQSAVTPPTFTKMKSPALELTKLDCPQGSIMIENMCRKVICSLGEYYRGSCLQSVCPQGLVWRGKKCQEPGYSTTILEIDNVFINQVNEKPFALHTSSMNEVSYHTTMPTIRKPSTISPTTNNSLSQLRKTETNEKNPFIRTLTTPMEGPTNSSANAACCKVITPRICKKYTEKWLCFNRNYIRCDRRICLSQVIYLKAPEIKYETPMLIMPPNPKLDICSDNCQNNVFDCSGCASLRSQNCSQYCYRYVCPKDTCTFMNLDEYCSYYPGQNGCLPEDGCLWNWCNLS